MNVVMAGRENSLRKPSTARGWSSERKTASDRRGTFGHVSGFQQPGSRVLMGSACFCLGKDVLCASSLIFPRVRLLLARS